MAVTKFRLLVLLAVVSVLILGAGLAAELAPSNPGHSGRGIPSSKSDPATGASVLGSGSSSRQIGTSLLQPFGVHRPLQDVDQEVDLAPGDVFTGYFDWCAYDTNTYDIVGYASASGDAAASTSPDYLSSGDLVPGACATDSYDITAPETPGIYSDVWGFGCYSDGGSGCNWYGPAYVTIQVNVTAPVSVSETTTFVFCSPDSVPQETDTSCDAIVDSDTGPTPTGTVDWSTNSLGGSFDTNTCDLVNGDCTVSYWDSDVGNWTITADYSGDANNDPSSGTEVVEVTQSSLTTTDTEVSCDPSSFDVSNYTECTATVSGDAPTGYIDWDSNSSDFDFEPASCELTTTGDSGTCTSDFYGYQPGKWTVKGDYTGDDGNLPSEGITEVEVTTGTVKSTTDVACDPPDFDLGDSTTCTATVTGSSPTGVVTFDDSPLGGSFDPVLCDLSDGSCSTTYTPSVHGNFTIEGSYSGDSENLPSSGSTLIRVNSTQGPSSTTVSCTPNPVLVNDTVTVSATVTGDSPTGTVVWSATGVVGTLASISCTLSGGACSTTFQATESGTAVIEGSYTGDTLNDPSSDSCDLTVSEPPPTYYDVTFTETGLPSGTSWSVTLDGTTQSSTTDSITFSETNGTYDYVVGYVDGYSSAPMDGTVLVYGEPAAMSVDFYETVPPPPDLYVVEFVEQGLPFDADWGVTLNWEDEDSTSTSIIFYEENGTMGYSVDDVDGYASDPSSGTVTVDGSDVTILIDFTQVTPNYYDVTFVEKGLKTGTSWGVDLGGTLQTVVGTSDNFVVPNGTYAWRVIPPSKHAPSPGAGTVIVDGGSSNVFVQFTSGTASNTNYPVFFNRTGLPRGATWGISGNGTHAFQVNTTGVTILVSLPPGSYRFWVAPVSGYVGVPGSGYFNVTSGKLNFTIHFQKLFQVTLNEPTGTPLEVVWNAYVNSTSLSPAELTPAETPAISLLEVTNAGNLTIGVPNGTYTYVLVVPGHPSLSTNGTFVVNGSKQNVQPGPTPPGPGPSPSQFLGLPDDLGYIIVIVVAVAIIVAVIYFGRESRARRRRDSSKPPETGLSASGSPGTPAAQMTPSSMPVPPPPSPATPPESGVLQIPTTQGQAPAPPVAAGPLGPVVSPPEPGPVPNEAGPLPEGAPNGLCCGTCGKPLLEPAKFCPNCGGPAPVEARFCADCGARVPVGATFCVECGKSLA